MKFYHRKLNRCIGWDYSSPGYYFVTLCIKNKKWIMSDVQNGKLIKNGLGIKISECWEDIPKHYSNCELDEYVLMPDHFHGIIKLLDTDKKWPLWEIIRGFKTFSSKEINVVMFGGFRWQKSFHDRIIQDEDMLNKIRKYIKENPEKLQV